MGSGLSVLIANRGEAAVRVARAVRSLGWRSVAVFASDDEASMHVTEADDAVPLAGEGPRAYLDADAILAVAAAAGCGILHPGWGFLSEDADFAGKCAAAGMTLAGPSAEVLEQLGDKVAALSLAREHAVPVLEATDGPLDVEATRRFMRAVGGPIMLKAVAGGGGRGMRPVLEEERLEQAFERCEAEAELATGSRALYAERLLPLARHVEVQVVGDGSGDVICLGDRDCSIQRRHQKLIEMAPAPGLPDAIREGLRASAAAMACAVRYEGLGTFEFLVETSRDGKVEGPSSFVFIEANPRLQVEHTVTEELYGIDLVAAQLRIATGARLDALGLRDAQPRGVAVQARVNLEAMTDTGNAVPTAGTLERFEVPRGEGVRVDTCGYPGYTTSDRYDSLLAKIIVASPDALDAALHGLERALGRLVVEGPRTNAAFLRRVLAHPRIRAGRWTIRFIDEHIADLAEPTEPGAPRDVETIEIRAPVNGVVRELPSRSGDRVSPGDVLVVVESMKMHHEVVAPLGGEVTMAALGVGDSVAAETLLVTLRPDGQQASAEQREELDLDAPRADLQELRKLHALTKDAARPAAVQRRRRTGNRTARENLADLLDEGSFTEYGGLAVAAQRARRPLDELRRRTPADGLVAGLGTINAERFGADSGCAVMAFDDTVFAGTHGWRTVHKMDRMIDVAAAMAVPMVLFGEGGGGRDGDTDTGYLHGLSIPTYLKMAELSGLVPTVAIVTRRCFAGNAVLAGVCDVIIATTDVSLGMAGPAMIAGGGLGTVATEDVGPIDVHTANGVVDLRAEDEAEAVGLARRYLAYFQGPVAEASVADQRRLRHIVPEDARKVFDMRAVIETLFDERSVLELRRGYGQAMVTALARIGGRAVGVVANDPAVLSGAIDGPASDKFARFIQLCDAHGLPLVTLLDTPGFMVGPEHERTGLVRRASRTLLAAASSTVPIVSVAVRRGFGLGAMAMTGGHFHRPRTLVAWPSSSFGAEGIEGKVRLGRRRELDSYEEGPGREAAFERMVADLRAEGDGVNLATYFEIDDVIDPATTRRRILACLAGQEVPPRRGARRRPMIDSW